MHVGFNHILIFSMYKLLLSLTCTLQPPTASTFNSTTFSFSPSTLNCMLQVSLKENVILDALLACMVQAHDA